jgi:hypothetical protein
MMIQAPSHVAFRVRFSVSCELRDASECMSLVRRQSVVCVYFQLAYRNWLLALGLVEEERLISKSISLYLSVIELACSILGRFHNYMHGNTPRFDVGVVSLCLERCVWSCGVRASRMYRSLALRVLSLPSHIPLTNSCCMHALSMGLSARVREHASSECFCCLSVYRMLVKYMYYCMARLPLTNVA